MEYLESRGIGPNTARKLGLGYVNPDRLLEGWERFAGRLAIPYLNMRNDPVWLKFRATPYLIPEADKMAQQEGSETRLYNTIALSAPGDTLVLCEGEFDVITLTALGLPAVGIPGAGNWKGHFHKALEGWSRVVLFYDSDQAGRDLVKTVRAKMPDIIPLPAPGGHNDIGKAYEAGLGDRIVAMALGKETEHEQEDTEGQPGGGEGRDVHPSPPADASGTEELNGILNPDGRIPF